MYIVFDKQTKEILWKNPAPITQQLTPLEIWQQFNPEKMSIAKCEKNIPEFWKVDENSNIIELTLEEKINEGIVKLDTIKNEYKIGYSRLALETRKSFLPDYKILNCCLKIYEKNYSIKIKHTINAFRKEYYRIESLINNAKTLNDLNNITPNFPTTLLE